MWWLMATYDTPSHIAYLWPAKMSQGVTLRFTWARWLSRKLYCGEPCVKLCSVLMSTKWMLPYSNVYLQQGNGEYATVNMVHSHTRFNNTTGFYWSYMLSLKLPVWSHYMIQVTSQLSHESCDLHIMRAAGHMTHNHQLVWYQAANE